MTAAASPSWTRARPSLDSLCNHDPSSPDGLIPSIKRAEALTPCPSKLGFSTLEVRLPPPIRSPPRGPTTRRGARAEPTQWRWCRSAEPPSSSALVRNAIHTRRWFHRLRFLPARRQPALLCFSLTFFPVRSCAAGVVGAGTTKVAVILAELQVRACG